jgi:hypothetical protein
MAEPVQLTLAGGGTITVQAEDTGTTVAGGAGLAGSRGGERGRGSETVERVTRSFDDSLSGLSDIANSLQSALQKSLTPPDAVTVNFGINFDLSGGIVLKASGGASLAVTMTWNKA